MQWMQAFQLDIRMAVKYWFHSLSTKEENNSVNAIGLIRVPLLEMSAHTDEQQT